MRPLDPGFNAAILSITAALFPAGFDLQDPEAALLWPHW